MGFFFTFEISKKRKRRKRRAARRKKNASGKRRLQEHREAARILAVSRLEYYNRQYGFSYAKISIRDQKTRWGSCSLQGNLSFNYRIALLPNEIADYVIVHELCHLGEFSHSERFWMLVERSIPNHKECRRELRRYGILLR